ncbi:MAG: hypothetical protein GOMPHAMPRED_001459 [Gomphillus americanus]|uniref:Syntaxin n=1 Tax=Gomphillus americanus TaxID=1940652 RepID=A0A8H3F2T5_9LECA|nr:MAG: hypothetical protein GOMPHAMPRED_001459 [Gomphillus americanus]
MAPNTYTLQIPSTSTVQKPTPHTVYNITITLPLQTITLQKRYSDFLSLHSQLTSQAGSPPPISPPPKTYLPSFFGGSTKSNPTLIETRRRGLEAYLQTLSSKNTHSRWRETSAWRAFLNLPSTHGNNTSTYSRGTAAHGSQSSTTEASLASDPALWLDTQREVKTLLQEARKHVFSARNTTSSPANSHEENAEAKKLLVRASGMISMLERGLKSAGDEWGARERLGDGEMRRRKDLMAQARKEKDDLEGLLSKIGTRQNVEAVVEKLTSTQSNGDPSNTATVGGGGGGGGGGGIVAARPSKGRVLGKETAKTRELDNTGVLQLQQQMMREQDEDVDVLTAAVTRQRELATQINEELTYQEGLFNVVEEDVDRLNGKINVARKRVAKIS